MVKSKDFGDHTLNLISNPTQMRRALLHFLFLLPSTLVAQTTIDVGGQQVGYGIAKVGEMPASLRVMLRNAEQRVANGVEPRRTKATAPGTRSDAAGQTIGPLLATVRAQEEPYNRLCPTWTDENGVESEARCLTGCVATSIEQILTYYRFPEALRDTLFGWTTDYYTIGDLYPGTRFDWPNIRNDYRNGYTDAEADAIALLSLACGMSVHMNYGLDASGANHWWGLDAFRRVFGFEVARCLDRVLYTPERWNALLRHELEQGHPLAYAGHNMELGGHAFNIDGVDSQGFYHVNWGYGGAYDGWYDLDWLNPWETTDIDSMGIAEGFFCNHSVLLLHPTADDQPWDADSLNIDSLGVVCDSVTFLRKPDLQGFVPVDFHFRNTGPEPVTYTYEVMTWLPSDTAIFLQADYVGLAALTIPAGECKTQRTYCRFSMTGDRLFGLSHDDVTIPFTQNVSVENGVRSQLEWGSATAQVEGSQATFTIQVKNQSQAGIAGDLVTFCLYSDGMEGEDTRHWTVLQLPGGESETLQVTFNGLEPATHYNFLVRCPWQIVASADFTTGIAPLRVQQADLGPVYDLSGRRIPASASGSFWSSGRAPRIVVSSGHKYLVR